MVDFYDRRFDMKLSDEEKEDLVNFLGRSSGMANEYRPGMNTNEHKWTAMILFVLVAVMTCAAAFGQERSFVSCPIVRDTKTVPCFLAEYEGEMYYLGSSRTSPANFTLRS